MEKFSIDKNNNLLISIVAGCTIDSIEAEVGKKIKIIRAMPNTPASIGMGVSALTNNHLVTLKDKTRAENIFNSVGISCWLKETSFDLYTALIGSGPAYVFYLIEALQLSAEKLGLDKDLSKTLIIEMITGSADTSQLGGPIRIAKITGQISEYGIIPFFSILAYISISLGLINLFPIPMLDGGHLMFYFFEKILGKPLSQKIQEGFFRIGLFLLFSLMFFVTFNDLRDLGLF